MTASRPRSSSGVDDPIHVWQRCHGCGAEPIVGRRYDCRVCPAGPDNHLCTSCYSAFRLGLLEHPNPNSYASHRDFGRHEFTSHDGVRRDTYAAWGRVADAGGTPPPLPNGFVVRPEFFVGGESFWGSYAFLAHTGSHRTLLLTALHVLDEICKSRNVDCTQTNEGYSGEALPSLIDRVVMYDMTAPKWILAERGTAGPMLVLPGARTFEPEPYCQGDVAAFLVSPPRIGDGVPVAAERPAIGEPIWLVAPSGRPQVFAAVVVESTDRSLIFRYSGAAALPRGTSGAPLVASSGAVVGLNVGGGTLDGIRYGHASHVESIRGLLTAAGAVASRSGVA